MDAFKSTKKNIYINLIDIDFFVHYFHVFNYNWCILCHFVFFNLISPIQITCFNNPTEGYESEFCLLRTHELGYSQKRYVLRASV